MFQVDVQTIALIILGPLAVLYMLKHLMAWFHAKKSKVDEFQKVVARGSGVCRQAQLPMLAEILVNAAALDLNDGFAAMKVAIHSVDTMPELIKSLEANFVWQFDYRAKTSEGVELVAEACLNNPVIMASIMSGMEAEEEAAAIEAVRKEAIKAAMPKAKTTTV